MDFILDSNIVMLVYICWVLVNIGIYIDFSFREMWNRLVYFVVYFLSVDIIIWNVTKTRKSPVKMEVVKEESEDMSETESCRMKNEDTEEQRG